MALDPAWAAIIGAAVGGGITGTTTLQVARLRDKREQERERKAVRSAARLVANEIDDARASYRQVLQEGRWGVVRFETTLWEEHRNLLSSALSDDEWTKVRDSTLLVELQGSRRLSQGGHLPDDRRDEIQRRHDQLTRGVAALGNHGADPREEPPRWRLLERRRHRKEFGSR